MDDESCLWSTMFPKINRAREIVPFTIQKTLIAYGEFPSESLKQDNSCNLLHILTFFISKYINV